MTPAEVSVVIPAINERRSIGRAVRSAWRAGAGEVVVADGGSTDGTPEHAARAAARVLDAPPGRAAQQNAAARDAGGRVLVFLHADNWLGRHCLERICGALAAAPDRWGGALRQRIMHPAPKYRVLERGNAARVRWRGLPFGDQAIFVRREAFEAAGGFPEIPLMEDLALARELRRRRWPLLLDGPVYVSPRRWQRHGVTRQTLTNWSLQLRYLLGAEPATLAARYRRHDASA